MTLDIKVNNHLIAHLRLYNTGPKEPKSIEQPLNDWLECTYDWEYVLIRPEVDTVQRIFTGTVNHNRKDGAEVLIHKILFEIEKQKRIGITATQ